MRAIFNLSGLVQQIKAGQLEDAFSYVVKFVPLYASSYEATILALFLQDLKAIDGFAGGTTMAAAILCHWYKSIYKLPLLAKYPCFATLVDNVLFLRPDLIKASLDWQLVRNKAAQMAEAMVYKTPELSVRLNFPPVRKNLYHVVPLPIGSSFRRSRQLKNRNLGWRRSTDLTQFYLQMKKRLPSSGQGEYCGDSGSVKGQGETLIALFEEALQAGRRPVLIHGYHPPEYSSKDVFPLEDMLSGEVRYETWWVKELRPELPSKQGLKVSHSSHSTALPGHDSKEALNDQEFP